MDGGFFATTSYASGMSYISLASGGALAALSTTPIAVDLSALAGRRVHIWCDENPILFSGAATNASTTLLTAATVAASATALVADSVGAGVKAPRLITADFPYLIVGTSVGTGTLRVKVISRKDPSQ